MWQFKRNYVVRRGWIDARKKENKVTNLDHRRVTTQTSAGSVRCI